MWDLSPIYKHSSSLFIPPSDDDNGALLLQFLSSRLVLRLASSLQILRTWSLPLPSSPSSSSSAAPPSQPTSFSVSPLQPHLILIHFSQLNSCCFIYDPHQNSLVAQFKFGNEGAEFVAWSHSNPYQLLVWSAGKLKLSIYNLASPGTGSTGSPVVIQNPKFTPSPSNQNAGYTFSPGEAGAKYLAVLERHGGKDSVGIYEMNPAPKLIRHFLVNPPSSSATQPPDISSITWSPCGRYLSLLSSPTSYSLHLHTPDGRFISTYPSPSTSSEKHLGLGLKSLAWHPSGDYLAVGDWDGKVVVLTRFGWVAVASWEMNGKGAAECKVERVREEPKGWIEKTRGKGIVAFETPTSTPYSPPYTKPDLSKPLLAPKMGVSILSWSGTTSSARFLAAFNPSFPRTLWIYSLFSSSSSPLSSQPQPPRLQPSLFSLITLAEPLPPSPSFVWHCGTNEAGEEEALLVVGTGRKCFVTWRWSEGTGEVVVDGVGIPARTAFNPSTMVIAPDGGSVLLADKELYALAYPVREEDEGPFGGGRTWEEE